MPPRPPLGESTARFIFQAAIGVGFFCVLASLFLGMRDAQVGAAIFLVLGIVSLGVIYRYGQLYFGLRRQRWAQELARPQAALEQLFERARAEQAAPGTPAEPGPAPEDTDRA